MNDFENISDISNDGYPLLNKRYKLIKKIGEGSYGVVYKANDICNNNSLVAIKQISKMRVNSNAYLIEALKKELFIMRLLSDENSVKLIEDFETEEKYNLVMELCDSDLDIELKKRKKETKKGFNELEVQAIMNQFNQIFKKMQKERVIHRDLKLKNIMIKYDKNAEIIGFIVKLSDFGFSKVMYEGDITDTNLGSPATKAPEIMKGKEYNAKADLWSIGVIMYQLFFDSLPFPARTVRELKEAIFRANGVRLPKGEEDCMTQICFDLIDKLLQKDPKRRIDFDDYFKHKFFSEEHKKNLMDKIKNNIKNEKVVYNEYKEENTIKEEKSEDDSDKDSNYSDKEKKIYKIDDKNNDFEKRFIKKLLIKEHKDGFKLFKAKDITYDRYVFIKEYKKSFIDDNPIHKKIFSKEIKLLSELKRKKFPEFYGLFYDDNFYYIVIEYFSGNNLYDFINNRNNLNENLIALILNQLKSSLTELSEKRIFLDFISPKNFAFTFYQNDTNFEIKFFDYGLYSIFCDEKYIQNYLLSELKLGDEPNVSINILSMGLTIYKMFFGEEAIVKKTEEDYEIKIKGKMKGECSDKLKIFLSKCIKKENRYTLSEFYYDDFLNGYKITPNLLSIIENKGEPIIKDEMIETILEIIIKKINYVINYFEKIFKEKDNALEDEIYIKFYEEIVIFLLFSFLECKTIINFLEINADIPKEKIDQNNQEIHALKIYINKNNKDNNKYDYTHINFLIENKNNLIYFYNKENPDFSYYLKIFQDIEKKISILLNRLLEKSNINKSSKEKDELNNSSDCFESACSQLLELNNQDKAFSDDINIRNNDNEERLSQKGNLEHLFMHFFEKGVVRYTNQEKEKAIDELKIAKYIVEYAIFQRVILGNKDKTINFEKLVINDYNKEMSYEDQNAIFVTFLGGKIKKLKEIGIIKYNSRSSKENLDDYNDPKFENIKIYDNMINFYPRIIQFIDEIKKENN